MIGSFKKSFRYFRSCALKRVRGRGLNCPSCGGRQSEFVQRKWLVTALRRCADCRLLFRTPTTTVEENNSFYQTDYQQGFTTEMPPDSALEELKATRFAGHEKCYDENIAVLRALGVNRGAKVFDFGCSWGYGSYQLAQSGFEVDAFEISQPRADFARTKLDVTVRRLDEDGIGTYDVFFSAHVIEHVPSVAEMIQLGMNYLKPGGLYVAFTPNGSASHRAVNAKAWHQLWGLVHPQLIDEEFLMHRFAGAPLLVTSWPHPLDAIAQWDRGARPKIAGLEGHELMFAVQKVA